jgi:hypothetical protein
MKAFGRKEIKLPALLKYSLEAGEIPPARNGAPVLNCAAHRLVTTLTELSRHPCI